MRKKVKILLDDGCEIEYEFPAHYEVCGRCEGKGVHDPEAFCGYVNEMMAEDPDFAEQYFGGVYDVQCSVCRGLRVVLTINQEEIETMGGEDAEMLRQYEEYQFQIDCMKAERMAELRMGA